MSTLDPRPTQQEFDFYCWATPPKQYPTIGWTKGVFDNLNGTVLKVIFEVYKCEHCCFFTRDGLETFVNRIINTCVTAESDRPYLFIEFYHYCGKFKVGMSRQQAQKLAFTLLAELDSHWENPDPEHMFKNMVVSADDSGK